MGLDHFSSVPIAGRRMRTEPAGPVARFGQEDISRYFLRVKWDGTQSTFFTCHRELRFLLTLLLCYCRSHESELLDRWAALIPLHYEEMMKIWKNWNAGFLG
jgi:hypothetical protein